MRAEVLRILEDSPEDPRAALGRLRAWLASRPTLPEDTHAVALLAPNEDALHELSARLTAEGVEHRLVCEIDPPFCGQAVALAVPPSPRGRLRKLFSKFHLIP